MLEHEPDLCGIYESEEPRDPRLCLPSLGMAMRVIVGVYVACRLWPTPVGLQEFCAKVSKKNGGKPFGKPALVSAVYK